MGVLAQLWIWFDMKFGFCRFFVIFLVFRIFSDFYFLFFELKKKRWGLASIVDLTCIEIKENKFVYTKAVACRVGKKPENLKKPGKTRVFSKNPGFSLGFFKFRVFSKYGLLSNILLCKKQFMKNV